TANFFTADSCSFCPLPAGLSAAVTTATISSPACKSASSEATANSGVPIKMMRIIFCLFFFNPSIFTFAKVQNIFSDLNFPFYLAKRTADGNGRRYSKLIVRVAVAGIMLGLAVMILSVAILKGFKGSIIAKERGFNGDITLYKHNLNNSYESSPFQLTSDSLTLLTKLPGIVQLNAFATKPGIINADEEVEGVVLKGIDSSYNQAALQQILVAGKVLQFNDSIPAQQQILVSKYTATRLKLKVGDRFLMYFVQEPLRKRKFTVIGIYNLGVE